MVFADSPPCNVYETIMFGAEQIAPGMSGALFNLAKSVVAIKGTQGFPPFPLDPQTCMKTVDLSGERRIFFFQGSSDYVVPEFNYYQCIEAATASAKSQNVNITEKINSHLFEVDYSKISGRGVDFCDGHLVPMYVDPAGYEKIMIGFFKDL